jgi:hypothetical protein
MAVNADLQFRKTGFQLAAKNQAELGRRWGDNAVRRGHGALEKGMRGRIVNNGENERGGEQRSA